MSIDDLRKRGHLRDEALWGVTRRSAVNVPAFLASGALGIAGCAAMAAGEGRWLTWVGIPAFLLGLFLFIGINLRGVTLRTDAPDRPEIQDDASDEPHERG